MRHVVRSQGVVSVRGGMRLACDLTCVPVKTKRHFWFYLSFLGLWMEKTVPLSWVRSQASLLCGGASRSYLEGQALKFLLRERELPQYNVLRAQDLCMQ